MRGIVSTNDIILEGFINVDKKTNLETLNVTKNGTYSADDIEADGWDEVIVNVPQSASNIESLSVTENGTYNAPSGVDGYNPVVVNVPQPTSNIEELIVHANGTYNAPSGVDGYNPVTVNVPGPTVDRLETSINHNGTFNVTENKPYGTDYYDPVIVTVDVPEPVLIPKFINANGVYLASSENADGFATVTVNVPNDPYMPLNSVQISSISNKYMGEIPTSEPIVPGYYAISHYNSDQIAGDTNLAIIKIESLPTRISLSGLSAFRLNVTTNSVEVDNYDGSAKDVYMSIMKVPNNAICVKPD